jgi:hypothetical protein
LDSIPSGEWLDDDEEKNISGSKNNKCVATNVNTPTDNTKAVEDEENQNEDDEDDMDMFFNLDSSSVSSIRSHDK